MTQMSPRRLREAHLLNTDGRRHPLANTLTVLTMILGTVALASAFDDDLYWLGSWAGLAGTLTGLGAQYLSETTAERFFNVIFLGAAFVGWGRGMSRGGF
jgi:hypothetical protein